MENWKVIYKDGYNYFERSNENISCIVTPMLFHYLQVQLFLKKDYMFCELEVRSKDVDKLFSIGDIWFEDYSNGDLELIKQNSYHIENEYWAKWHSKEDKTLIWV